MVRLNFKDKVELFRYSLSKRELHNRPMQGSVVFDLNLRGLILENENMLVEEYIYKWIKK
jgi:hypothetical protein